MHYDKIPFVQKSSQWLKLHFQSGRSWRQKTEKYLAFGWMPKPNVEISLNCYPFVLFAVLILILTINPFFMKHLKILISFLIHKNPASI